MNNFYQWLEAKKHRRSRAATTVPYYSSQPRSPADQPLPPRVAREALPGEMERDRERLRQIRSQEYSGSKQQDEEVPETPRSSVVNAMQAYRKATGNLHGPVDNVDFWKWLDSIGKSVMDF